MEKPQHNRQIMDRYRTGTMQRHPNIRFTVYHSIFITVATTLTAWWSLYKITNSVFTPTIYTPIWYNPDFIINKKTLNFSIWMEKASHILNIFITTIALCHSSNLSRNVISGALSFYNTNN